MKVDAELFDLCKDFIREYKITSEEDILNDEHISNNCLDLLKEICDLIGYYEEEDMGDLFEEE